MDYKINRLKLNLKTKLNARRSAVAQKVRHASVQLSVRLWHGDVIAVLKILTGKYDARLLLPGLAKKKLRDDRIGGIVVNVGNRTLS